MNTPQEAIKSSLAFSRHVTNMCLDKVSGAALLVRPVPSANHIAWQLGHLISTECKLLVETPAAQAPVLPDGFAESYTSESSKSDDPSKFETKDRYLELYDAVRAGTNALLDRLSVDDLNRPGPEFIKAIAPTLGEALGLQALHEMMHVGQFSVVRRKEGLPIAF